jgi:arylsulfatase A
MKNILFVLCFLSWGPAAASADAADRPPNIIFILADDLGIGNVGCYGADHYQTPHLDALAASGLRYERAYTAPLCGPSRALIMTGRYAFRTGATNQDRVGGLQPERETMLPAYLKQAGYRCGAFGKWSQFSLQPSDWGFDEYLRFSGSGVYRSTDGNLETYVVNGAKRELAADEYMPDLLHEHVTKFIRRHRDSPFFLYYSMSSVHGELLPTPDSTAESSDLMADNVAYMDKLFGRLVDELRQQQLLQQTVIVFMGDNGTGKGQAERATIGGRRLTGQKGSMQEGGALVPLIVSWPGVIAGGRVSGGVLDSSDFVPTFAELAGVKLPVDRLIDGRSLLPQWRGAADQHRSWAFVQLARSWYVREQQWKLNEAGELYDMSQAPFAETLVVESADTEAARSARQRLAAVLGQLNPAGGILDDGDGSGRHSGRRKKGEAE